MIKKSFGAGLIIMFLLSIININVSGENLNYFRYDPAIEKLKEKTDFKLFLPQILPQEWIVEIKRSETVKGKVKKLQIHFLDTTDTVLLLAITEQKRTSKNFEKYGELVKINSKSGYFYPLSPSEKYKDVQGGLLTWVQEGTEITFFSSRLSKKDLIAIATKME